MLKGVEGDSRFTEKKEVHYGLQGRLGVTTSSWLFTDETKGLKGAFAVTNALNNNRAREDWIGIEIYPTDPRVIDVLKKVPGFKDFIPPHVTPDMVARLHEEYPLTRVDQIHMPFSATGYEANLHRPTVGENFRPVKDGVKQRVFQGAWMFMFRPALDEKSVNLAEELGVGINAHVNVIEAMAQKGNLEDAKKRLSFIQAENERPYRSPYGNRLKKAGISSQQLMSDPVVIKEHVVQKYGLDGLLFGVDHAFQVGFDPVGVLGKVSDVMARVHIAGGEGAGGHQLISSEDPAVSRFFNEASTMRFDHAVSVAFDGNPLEFRKMSFEEQVGKLDSLFKWIDATQGRR